MQRPQGLRHHAEEDVDVVLAVDAARPPVRLVPRGEEARPRHAGEEVRPQRLLDDRLQRARQQRESASHMLMTVDAHARLLIATDSDARGLAG
jgi:hypothetical protein